MNKIIQNETISHLSVKNFLSAVEWTGLGDPLPLVKRFNSGEDIEKVGKNGVVESGLKPGDFVVIRRSKKLV